MLTAAQIQYLDSFCIKKGVRYYDLRLEIVDHLATAIEAKMQQNLNLDFNDALTSVYKGFGIFGFGKIVNERHEAHIKYLKSLSKKYLKAYFTIPKIVATLLMLVLATIIVITHPLSFDVLFTLCIIIAAFTSTGLGIYSTVYFRQKKIKFFTINQSPNKLLILNWYDNLGAWFLIPQLINSMLKIFNDAEWISSKATPVWLSLLIVSGTIFVVLHYFAIFNARKTMYAKAKQDYPLAFQ